MIHTAYSPPFQQFQKFQQFENQQFEKRITQPKQINKSTKLKAAIGATVGTILPLAFMMKEKNIKNPLKLEYSAKEMLLMTGSSIIGGTIAGMFNENRETRKNKFKEGVFQFLNATLPTIGVASGLKLCAKQKNFDCAPYKILSVMAGIAVGMFGALKLSNFIFDPKDEKPDRKFSPKDCLSSIDDTIGALALAKFPLTNAIQLNKALPLIYGYCGYRAGK